MINVEELKKQTFDAIRKGKEELAAKQKAAQEAAKKKDDAARREAETFLQLVPEVCREAAAKAQREARLMKIQYGDFKPNSYASPRTELQLEHLTNLRIKYIVQALKEIPDLKVTMEYQHDGQGMDSWYELVVSW